MLCSLRNEFGVWVLLCGVLACAGGVAETACYVPGETWVETMCASREAYAAWVAQDEVRSAVTLAPWYVSVPMGAKDLEESHFDLAAPPDLGARGKDDKPLWRKQSTLLDNVPHYVTQKDSASTYLYRKIVAAKALTATAALGRDDAIEVWLNGAQAYAGSGRHGLGQQRIELPLALQEGENLLLLKVFNVKGPTGFYFGLGEEPAIALWDKVKANFPAEARWMARDKGEQHPRQWFAVSRGAHMEEQLIKRALAKVPRVEGGLWERLDALDKEDAPEGDRQWLDLYVSACCSQEALTALGRIDPAALGRALTDLCETYPSAYPADGAAAGLLTGLEERLAALGNAVARGEEQGIADSLALAGQVREALLANPLINFERLVVVKRGEGQLGLPQNWQGNCAMSSRGYDNEIAVLSPMGGDGALTTLYRPDGGKFVGDVDLSFDSDTMLFSMPGSHNRWQIFEIQADGSGLRQVTPGEAPDVDNYDACYLPDGRVMFGSTRCFQGIPCVGGGNQVANLCLLDTATNNVRQLCFDQDHNWCPTLLNNGRVMYSRWEYSDTPHYFSRLLFHMNPDGTGQMEYYGSNSFWPNSIFYARPIPNHPSQFVAIVSGHHGVPRMGELIVFDPSKGRHEADGVIQRIPGWGQEVEPIIADQLVNSSWPRFLHPYPLSEKYFLVSCKPTPEAPWGIYLADVFDNLTLMKEVPGYALFEPVPFRKTERPPIIPDKVDLEQDEGTIYVVDVYAGEGMRGVPRGTVKKMRVYELHYAYPQMGGHIHVAVEGAWDVHRVLGTVDVNEDGSSLFRAPANTPIAIQPLDAEGKAVQLMRSWFTAMPGETLSCAGCHEQQNSTPPARDTLAGRYEAQEITPWYGPPRGFSFKREVQPVLDRHCVGCHDGEKEHGGQKLPDFRAKEKNGWSNFTPSYLALHPYVRRPGPESDYHILKPMEYHADTSELVQMLQKGHKGVELDPESWDRLITWIDLNVPDHGTWSEHRNIAANFHDRRMAMRTTCAMRPEDPEEVPAVLGEPPAYQAPAPVTASTTRDLAHPGWPIDGDTVLAMQRETAGEAKRTVDLGDGLSLEMVLVPAGSFVMGMEQGPADNRPRCVVEVKEPFWMGVTEVTNGQYGRFDAAHDTGVIDQHHKDHNTRGYPANMPELPVARISWEEAVGFCDWLSARTGEGFALPTEAQWEWACRAGTESPLYYGDLDADFSDHGNMADFRMQLLAVGGVDPKPIDNPNPYMDFLPKDARSDDKQKVVAAVAQYQPNPWGLFDMHGNVAEWTGTAFLPYPYDVADGRDDAGVEGKKVVRGGSWRDRPKRCRSAFRLAYKPWQKVFNVGFRVVCPAEAPTRVAAADVEK